MNRRIYEIRLHRPICLVGVMRFAAIALGERLPPCVGDEALRFTKA